VRGAHAQSMPVKSSASVFNCDQKKSQSPWSKSAIKSPYARISSLANLLNPLAVSFLCL